MSANKPYVLAEHWKTFKCGHCGNVEYCKDIPDSKLCYSCRKEPKKPIHPIINQRDDDDSTDY